jgi:hypothetical protein
MSNQTMEDLQRFKSSRALPTWDLTLQALLREAGPGPGQGSGNPANGQQTAAEQQS